jgi:hypothetical protein
MALREISPGWVTTTQQIARTCGHVLAPTPDGTPTTHGCVNIGTTDRANLGERERISR